MSGAFMTSSPASFGLVLALGSAAFYGYNIIYARLASFAGVTGSTIVVYRVVLMLALVLAAALIARRSLRVPPEERGIIALLGVSTAVVGLCYVSSVSFIPVAVAAVVFYTFPILIVLFSPFVEGTRLTPALLSIAGLALVGVALVVGPAFGALDWRGVGLAFLASIATAVQFFAAARCRRTGVFAKLFWIHLVVLPTAAMIGLATASLAGPAALLLAPYAVAMTIGQYMLGFLLQFLALARIPAVAAGIVYCAEPVIAAVASRFVLGESLTGVQYAGGALVIAAIIANILHQQRGARAAPALQDSP